MTNAPIAAANPLLAAALAVEVRAMAAILPMIPRCGVYRTRDPRAVPRGRSPNTTCGSRWPHESIASRATIESTSRFCADCLRDTVEVMPLRKNSFLKLLGATDTSDFEEYAPEGVSRGVQCPVPPEELNAAKFVRESKRAQ